MNSHLRKLFSPQALRRYAKAITFIRAYGFAGLRGRGIDNESYRSWIAANEDVTASARAELVEGTSKLLLQPRISILLPVFNPAEQYLRQAIESVRAQLYQNWELCIVDDNSPLQSTRDCIREYAALDPRIRYEFRQHNGGIAEATNSAASMATGEFFGFLDHDDLLRDHALSEIVLEINRHPDAAMFFSDEDRISPDNARHNPYFKSDWDPELMLSHNAVCHFMVTRVTLFQEVGGLRSAYDGAQDWDLVLRISERVRPEQIRHLSAILYHWREIPGSTAQGLGEKAYVQSAQERVVQEHLKRRGEANFLIEDLPGISMKRVRFAVSRPAPKVSLVLSSATVRDVACILKATEYPNLEVLVVVEGAGSSQERGECSLLSSQDPRISLVAVGSASPEAIALNVAASKASGDLLCFVAGCVFPRSSDWLSELIANAIRKDIGAVGPKIISRAAKVKSAGLRVLSTGPCGMFAGLPARHPGYFNHAILPRTVPAVSAECFVIKTERFREVGGFESGVERHNIDLCLKLASLGQRTICVPSVVMVNNQMPL